MPDTRRIWSDAQIREWLGSTIEIYNGLDVPAGCESVAFQIIANMVGAQEVLTPQIARTLGGGVLQ